MIVNGVNLLKELLVFQIFGHVDFKTCVAHGSLTSVFVIFSGLVDIEGK